jgi:hypothetical protein
MRRLFTALVLWGLAVSLAQAHVASNSFLELEASGRDLRGSLEIAIRDAELAVGVDGNRDGRITWGELRASGPKLIAYLRENLAFSAQGHPCSVRFGSMLVNARVDGNYAHFPVSLTCAGEVKDLKITYRLLAGIDPSHRGLLRLTAGGEGQTAVLGGGNAELTLSVAHPDRWRAFRDYLQAGVWHIWSGIDHLLFLLSLLLPAVLVRRELHWEPVPAAGPAVVNILKVVTAFTIAHSLTLSLAAFNLVHLPSRLTESVIAASIIVAALNNVFPLITESRARIAFAFGLLHGFGFASVLAEMGLPNGARLVSLVAFNLGIELGQLAVVLTVMPLAFAMRGGTLYRRAILPWGSAGIAALALVWLIQRALPT